MANRPKAPAPALIPPLALDDRPDDGSLSGDTVADDVPVVDDAVDDVVGDPVGVLLPLVGGGVDVVEPVPGVI